MLELKLVLELELKLEFELVIESELSGKVGAGIVVALHPSSITDARIRAAIVFVFFITVLLNISSRLMIHSSPVNRKIPPFG